MELSFFETWFSWFRGNSQKTGRTLLKTQFSNHGQTTVKPRLPRVTTEYRLIFNKMEKQTIDLRQLTDDDILELAKEITLIENPTDQAVEILNILRNAQKITKNRRKMNQVV